MAKSVKIKDDHYRLIGLYLLVAAVGIAWLFCGCATRRSTESSIDIHRMSVMTERMDSLLHATSTWQKSLYEKQSSLVDSFKQSEVRDTSRIIFLGEKGDTVKETVVIKEYIEREHSSSKTETEFWQEMYHKTDSLLQASWAREEKMDSLYESRQKTAVVEKKPSLVERLKWIGLGVVLALLGGFAVVSAFMRKR